MWLNLSTPQCCRSGGAWGQSPPTSSSGGVSPPFYFRNSIIICIMLLLLFWKSFISCCSRLISMGVSISLFQVERSYSKGGYDVWDLYELWSMSHLSHELWTSMMSYDDVTHFFTISRSSREPPLINLFLQHCPPPTFKTLATPLNPILTL